MTVQEHQDWMPRISLVQDWKVAGSRGEIFQELGKPTFDPRRTVILDKVPVSVPMSGHVKSDAKNTYAILDSGGDHLTIKANLATPAILLITDNYSRGWRVRSMTPGAQKEYEILPANYTLMSIPLAAGEHLLRVEYRPQSFVIGAWVSVIAWLGFGGLLSFVFIRRRKLNNAQRGALP